MISLGRRSLVWSRRTRSCYLWKVNRTSAISATICYVTWFLSAGNKVFPQCGFSNTACRILDTLNVAYETVDVLADPDIRQGIKVFSSWPTIPQLYVNGEFIGGSDIMMELYQSGELAEMCEIANANWAWEMKCIWYLLKLIVSSYWCVIHLKIIKSKHVKLG